MSSDPYDNICAPQYVNFLSKSLMDEDNRENSLYFENAEVTPRQPFRPTPSHSTPCDDMDVSDEDKTITPNDYLEDVPDGLSKISATALSHTDPNHSVPGERSSQHNNPNEILCVALSNISLSHMEHSSTTPGSKGPVWDNDEIVAMNDKGKPSNSHPPDKPIMSKTDRLRKNFSQYTVKCHDGKKELQSIRKIFKRTRSPVPSSIRDYSLPPEKYISVSECTATFSKHKIAPQSKPKRPAQSSLRNSVPCVNISNQNVLPPIKKKVIGVSNIEVSRKNIAQTNVIKLPCTGRGVRIGRRPEPIVEPFKNTDYQRKNVTDATSSVKVKEFKAGSRAQILRKPLSRKNDKIDMTLNHTRPKELTSAAHAASSSYTANFFAHPPTVLHQKPFVPKKSSREPTRPLSFQLHTEQRAHKREEFERQIKGKMLHQDIINQVEAEIKQKRLESEIAQMRKDLVFRARPAPSFQPFNVKKSCKPLTKPLNPSLFQKRRE